MADIEVRTIETQEIIEATTQFAGNSIFPDLTELKFNDTSSLEVEITVKEDLPDGTPVYVLTGSSVADYNAVAIARSYNGSYTFQGNTSETYYLAKIDAVSVREAAEETGYTFEKEYDMDNVIVVQNNVKKLSRVPSLLFVIAAVVGLAVLSTFLYKLLDILVDKIRKR